MCENTQNCCRICLDVEADHVSILDPTIHLQIRSCLAITISTEDDLPKKICVSCVSLLNDFYNFQLNARCSQDWLESTIEERLKKTSEKPLVQPLPDSEYNSDSLLEFLNNTENIEDYLNNLGKECLSFVDMLDTNHESVDIRTGKTGKQVSPKKKEIKAKTTPMKIDVLDSDVEIVNKLLMKEPKTTIKTDKTTNICFGCKTKFENISKLSQHLSVCDNALRTCVACNVMYDSRTKMLQHSVTHNPQLTCNCGTEFQCKDKLLQHQKACHYDHTSVPGCIYRCKKCKMTFTDRLQLYKHAKEHILRADEHNCYICGKLFKSVEAFTNHQKEAHGKNDNLSYRCKICSLELTDHRKMYSHVQKHIGKEPRHLCESCGRSFATNTTLTRHLLLHKKEQEQMLNQKESSQTKLFQLPAQNAVLDHNYQNKYVLHHKAEQNTALLQTTNIKSKIVAHEDNNFKPQDPITEGIDLNINVAKKHVKQCVKVNPELHDKKSNRFLHEKETNSIKMLICDKCGQCVDCNKLDAHICT